PLPAGKGEIVFGDPSTAAVGVAAIGVTVGEAVKAAKALAEQGVEVCVVNARFAKPLDEDLLVRLAACPAGLITVEENVLTGGFGSGILELLADRGRLPVRVVRLGM